MQQFFAILLDSFHEAKDRKILWVLLAICGLASRATGIWKVCASRSLSWSMSVEFGRLLDSSRLLCPIPKAPPDAAVASNHSRELVG